MTIKAMYLNGGEVELHKLMAHLARETLILDKQANVHIENVLIYCDDERFWCATLYYSEEEQK